MKSLVLSFLFIFYANFAHASDFDSFILNYQSVHPINNAINLELVLDKPTENQIQKVLKKGIILKLSVNNFVYEKRLLLPAKLISQLEIVYYFRYDPLTRQYTVMQEAQTIARNLDANFLLDIIIKHISISIPTKLIKNKEYQLITKIQLNPSSNQPYIKNNLFFNSDNIIQPLEIVYDFKYQ